MDALTGNMVNSLVDDEEPQERPSSGSFQQSSQPPTPGVNAPAGVTPPISLPPPSPPTWSYLDPQGQVQGPFQAEEMLEWYNAGYFPHDLMVRPSIDSKFTSLTEMSKLFGRVPFTPGSAPGPIYEPDPDEERKKHQLLVQQIQQQLLVQQQQLLQHAHQQQMLSMQQQGMPFQGLGNLGSLDVHVNRQVVATSPKMWEDLVHTALLEILSYLPHHQIVHSAGRVCRRWHSLSHDSLLWKAILVRHFNLSPPLSLRTGAESWRREFIRMIDEVPSVLTDMPDHPIQEAKMATHVTFAHSGKVFSVCYTYRRHGVGVWTSAHPCKRVCTIQTFGWQPTSSKFNSSDTLLLVTGNFNHTEDLESFHIPSGEEMVAIYQAGGSVYPDHFSLIKIVKADCSFPYNGWVNDRAFLTTEAMDWDFRRVYLNSADPFDNEMDSDVTLLDDVLHPLSQSMTFCSIRDGLPKMMFQLGPEEQEFNINWDAMNNRPWSLAPMRIGVVGNDQLLNNHRHDLEIFTLAEEEFPHLLIAGFSPSPDHEMCYINARPLSRNAELEDNTIPIVFKSHEDLQIFPLNLTSMTTGPPLTGHKGLPSSNLNWPESQRLFPDVTNCYVGCGSEDGRGYVWDRHYSCLVSILSGTLDNPPYFSSIARHVPPVCQYRDEHLLNLLGIPERPPTVRDEEYHSRPTFEDLKKKFPEQLKKQRAMDAENAKAKGMSLKDYMENQVNWDFAELCKPRVIDPDDLPAIDERQNREKMESLRESEYKDVISVALDPTGEDIMVTIGKEGRIKVFRSKKWARENRFGMEQED